MVDDVPHRLISVNDSVLHVETITLFEVTFSIELNSLLIFGVNMPDPEKVVLLDFLITVAECLVTIRADVESAKLVVQAVGNQRGVFEKAAVSVNTVFPPWGSLETGSTAEVAGCHWRGSHQAYPGFTFT